MINAVIFDMDGVLIDTEKYLNKYWIQAGQEAGFDFRREHGLMIRSLAGKYAAPFLQDIFGESFDYWSIRDRRKELMKKHLDENGVEKKPFVDETLDALRAMGIKIAVATATDMERTSAYLKEIGIYDKFDKIVCAEMVANGKPQPDIYVYACECIGELPKNCVAVEDAPNGILAAHRAGLYTVMVPDLAPPDEEILPFIGDCVDNLKEVPEIVERLNGKFC